MSNQHRICPVKQDFLQWKSRSGTKMMNLRPDKLTTNKLDIIEQEEISRATRNNLFT
jgi:hypothetical protein